MSRTYQNLGLALLGIFAAVAVIAALGHTPTPPTPPSSVGTALPLAKLPSYRQPSIKLELPPAGSSVVGVGDSWVDGVGADKPSDGFIQKTASHFGWSLRVLYGNGGTGYVSEGAAGHHFGTYAERLAAQQAAPDPAVRLVILQGGINDAPYSTFELGKGEAAAFQAARHAYPNATLLVVGVVNPSAYPWPALAGIDDTLAAGALKARVAMVNPLDEGWLSGRAAALTHHSGPTKSHPTTQGHAVLAQLLIHDLERLKK